MASVTGLTAARMLEIENSSVVSGLVDVHGKLLLSTRGGEEITAGHVRGAPSSISVGGVTTLPPGSEPSIINRGTENDAVFDFAIPQGEQGEKGEKGDPGPKWDNGLPSGVNLNEMVTPGFYVQTQSANATGSLNYPIGMAGWLEVNTSPTGHMVYQRYSEYRGLDVYYRTAYNDVWSIWRRFDLDQGVWETWSYYPDYGDYNASTYPTGFRFVGNQVHLKGLITPVDGNWPASTSISNVFQLPDKARPTQPTFITATTTTGTTKPMIVINSSGVVSVRTSSSSTYISLDGISYFIN